MTSQPDFCLHFVEGFFDEKPRRCWRTKKIAFGVQAGGLVVRIDPPCSGSNYGLVDRDISFLLLSPKYQENSLFPVNEWPQDVYIFLPLIDGPELRDSLAQHEVRKIAFGEISLDNKTKTGMSSFRTTNPL
jgi:hypothetical protein